MNLFRFLGKCLTDPPAAWQSAKLVGRSIYGRTYWKLRPMKPLHYRIQGGGVLLLEPGHSFTHCFWPAVDRYEPDVRAALHHFLKPGDTFVDCGSNIGYFSVVAGHRVGNGGRVLSIEANPVTHGLLQRNLSLNKFGKAVHCALMATPGEVELFVPKKGGDVYSSVRKGGLVKGEEIESIKVPGRTLDDVVAGNGLDRIDLIKIDIEGGELDVLRSAPKILKEMRPIVVCEYGMNTWPAFGASAQALLELLAHYDYSVGVYQMENRQIIPVDESVWKAGYANLILIPKERFSATATGTPQS